MNVLLFGEDCGTHAMAWKVFNSPVADEVLCSPGNGGTGLFAPSAAVPSTDIEAVTRFVLSEEIDLVIADTTAIAAGIADEARNFHTPVFGSGKSAAPLIQSRCFQHEWLLKHGLPTVPGRTFEQRDQAEAYAATLPLPVSVIADDPNGPTFVCRARIEVPDAIESCFYTARDGQTSSGVLIAEWSGEPLVTASVFSDGQTSQPIPAVRLHQLATEPWSPIVGAHRAATARWRQIDVHLQQAVCSPLLMAFRRDGLPVSGWVGADCRLGTRGPAIARLRLTADPMEAALLLPQLQSDVLPLLAAVASGTLGNAGAPVWLRQSGVAVLVVATGWPTAFPTGQAVEGLDDLEAGVLIFHHETASPTALSYISKMERIGFGPRESIWSYLTTPLVRPRGPGSLQTITTGGSILVAVAHAPELEIAWERIYRNLRRIRVAGATFLPGVGENEV